MPVIGLSFLGYQIYSMQERGVDEQLFQSDNRVEVSITEESISFTPADDTLGTGLLFYPGALVDPDAYVPMARNLAEAGYATRIIKVPYRVTSMDWQKETVKQRTHQSLTGKNWVLAGHSRGARMALAFAKANESKLSGLILVGSSHPREINHDMLTIPIMKVYGTQDGLASPAEVEQYKHNLPAHTRWVRIEGGNHAQFGWYGTQLGDDDATISREEQQRQLVSAMTAFLADV